MRKMLLLVTLHILCVLPTFGQILVTTNTNPNQLAQKIVGQGVTVLNPTFKGASISAGVFRDANKTTGLDSGIVLTTGRAETVITGNLVRPGVNGAASLNASIMNNTSSDASLNALVSGNALLNGDACVLEFDFIPQGDSISVQFAMGSEEYPFYACSNFNDVFAFLISGPGIIGQKNIALIPGTNIPVAINSINAGAGGNGSLSNCTALGAGSPFSNLYVNNERGEFLTYNGLTRVLLASTKVIPCQVYHIKLAIQDVGDETLDSGVFLSANSFSSNSISIQNSNGFIDNQNNTYVVEGCKSSEVKFKLSTPSNGTNTFNLSYSGTATTGVDYVSLPNSITFGPGDVEQTLYIQPLIDNIPEPTETIIIGITNICSNSPQQSVTIFIKDSVAFTQVKDTFVCSAFPIVIQAKRVDTTSNSYLWSFGDTSRQVTIATPSTYWVKHTFSQNCYNIDTFRVANGDPFFAVSNNNFSFCEKDSVLVTTTVNPSGGNFLWSNNATNDALFISSSGNYQVRYTAPNGCYTSQFITATRKPLPYANLIADTSLCSYENITLNAFYPNASYLWSTGATSSSITVSDSAQYTIINTLNGCSVADTVFIGRKKAAIAQAGSNMEILAGGSAKLQAVTAPNNSLYNWQPANLVSNAHIYNPLATPFATTNFILTASSIDGCIAKDTLLITVKDFSLSIPNAFSPNGDGQNDTWDIPLLKSYLTCKVQVYNRAGHLVFNSIGYDKPFNGTYQGQALPMGTYYYVIEPGNNKPRMAGYITILR